MRYRVIKFLLNSFFSLLVVISLLSLPLAMPHCGDNGFYIGFAPVSDCQGTESGMSMLHLQEMMSILLATIATAVVFFVVVFVYYRKEEYKVIGSRLKLYTAEQGPNSFYYLMKPHDLLLKVLTKIYKKHFASA